MLLSKAAWYSVKRHDDLQLCNTSWCDSCTFPPMRSICTFCVSISFPMSSAMLFRFPMMLPTWDRFSSISSSRASLVTLRKSTVKCVCESVCPAACMTDDWWYYMSVWTKGEQTHSTAASLDTPTSNNTHHYTLLLSTSVCVLRSWSLSPSHPPHEMMAADWKQRRPDPRLLPRPLCTHRSPQRPSVWERQRGGEWPHDWNVMQTHTVATLVQQPLYSVCFLLE